jgi:hypothetical protein
MDRVIPWAYNRRYSETHRVEKYAQQAQRIAQQGHRCALRERSNLETLAGFLAQDLPRHQKDNQHHNASSKHRPNFKLPQANFA